MERRDHPQYEAAAPELIPLLDNFLGALRQRRPDLVQVREAMIALLEYLTTPAGRTDANCTAADMAIGADRDWNYDWPGLPEGFVAVISDMAGALHDTVSAPAIAEDFDSTPEQLLRRAKALTTE